MALTCFNVGNSGNSDEEREQEKDTSHRIRVGPKSSDILLAKLNGKSPNEITISKSHTTCGDPKTNVRKVRFFLPSKCDVKDISRKDEKNPNPKCESLLKNKKIIISTIEKQPYLENITKNHRVKDENKADQKNDTKQTKAHTEIYQASNLVGGPLSTEEVSTEGFHVKKQGKRVVIRPGSWPVTRIPKAKPRATARKNENGETNIEHIKRPEIQSAQSERSHVVPDFRYDMDSEEGNPSPRIRENRMVRLSPRVHELEAAIRYVNIKCMFFILPRQDKTRQDKIRLNLSFLNAGFINSIFL